MSNALQIIGAFEKEVGEEFPIDFNCANALPVGATSLASATVQAIDDLTGADVTTVVLLSGTATIIAPDNLLARVVVTGGTAETSYTLILTAITDSGSTIMTRTNMAVF